VWNDLVMTDHLAELKEAGEAYQQARVEADRIMASPREKLTEKARAAYANGTKKADILRTIGHVWSNTWLDKVLEGIEPPGGKRRSVVRKTRKTR
jgi:hypothetical protein